MVTVSENHLHYAQEVLRDLPSKNIIVEPQDDGTTFAVLHSAFRVREIDPNAIVVFFPPDLSVPDPRGFMSRVADAIEAIQRQPRLTLIGIEPSTPDTDREWIKPDLSIPIHEDLKIWPVQGLRDSVSQSDARELMKDGGLWNSGVMVGTISTFLRKIRRTEPEIYAAFKAAAQRFGMPDEAMAMRRIYYENHTESDFSRDVLQKSANQLAVIPVRPAKVRGVGRVSPEAAKFLHSNTAFGALAAAAQA
jgi:mannose-1-phosphate guanylyltransferase